jgi:phosphatidylglycerophosphate synthase
VQSNALRDLLALPNVLSAVRVPLGLAFPFARGETRALALIGAAGLTDLLDGWSARRLGRVTDAGAVIDGVADKTFAASVLGTLVLRRRMSPAAALILVSREILQLPLAIWAYRRARRTGVRVDASANRLGKMATTLELAAITATVLRSRLARPLVAVAGVVGALAGMSYVARGFRSDPRAPLR